MENEPLLDDLPIKHANYLLAMLNYWRVVGVEWMENLNLFWVIDSGCLNIRGHEGDEIN